MPASLGEADGAPPAKKPTVKAKANGTKGKGEDRAPDDDSRLYGKDKNDPVMPYVGMPIGNASCAQITTWAQMCCLYSIVLVGCQLVKDRSFLLIKYIVPEFFGHALS